VSGIRSPDTFLWQVRRDSNPQPPVLETGALPIELLTYVPIYKSSIVDFQFGKTAHTIPILKSNIED
jgi:hypothetical protein